MRACVKEVNGLEEIGVALRGGKSRREYEVIGFQGNQSFSPIINNNEKGGCLYQSQSSS